MARNGYRMQDDSVMDPKSPARFVGKSTSRRGEDLRQKGLEAGRKDGSSGAGQITARYYTSVNAQDPISEKMPRIEVP